jgi:hypothetical protein
MMANQIMLLRELIAVYLDSYDMLMHHRDKFKFSAVETFGAYCGENDKYFTTHPYNIIRVLLVILPCAVLPTDNL